MKRGSIEQTRGRCSDFTQSWWPEGMVSVRHAPVRGCRGGQLYRKGVTETRRGESEILPLSRALNREGETEMSLGRSFWKGPLVT